MEVYYANGRYFCGICSAGTRTKNVMIQHISMTHVEVNHIKFSGKVLNFSVILKEMITLIMMNLVSPTVAREKHEQY